MKLLLCLNLRTIFVSVTQTVSDKLMAGFVECLDNEEAEEGTENRDGERDVASPVSFFFSLETVPFSAFGLNCPVLIP